MNKERFNVDGKRLVSAIKDLIKQGNVNRIVVKDRSENVILDLPVGVIVVAALWAPLLAGLSAGLALFSDYEIDVYKKN